MKRFKVIGTDCEPDSWIDNTDQIKGVFEHETVEQILDEWDERIKFLEKENKELKEQLKDAIVPKYHLNQYVFVNRWGKPYQTRIDVVKAILIDGKVQIFYEYDAPGSYAHVEISEDGVFASEADAQKYLEEHK